MATVLTNAGEEFLIDKLAETTQDQAQWFGWGTGGGTAAKSDTALFTQASEELVEATVTKIGSGAAAKLQLVASIVADATKTITNFGVFTDGGVLVVHVDHGPITVDAGDLIEYTVTLDPS
jgi:hypothetical protein